jgi:hypothetical protein
MPVADPEKIEKNLLTFEDKLRRGLGRAYTIIESL